VAIYSPNCPEYAVVAYGTSIAGGTLTTLNLLHRAREVVYQSADAGAKVLFYHSMVRPVVDEAQPELPGVSLGAAPTPYRRRSSGVLNNFSPAPHSSRR
jgi:acyl-CoA synthetase (AMP-forming)/AMP-acid ligase II